MKTVRNREHISVFTLRFQGGVCALVFHGNNIHGGVCAFILSLLTPLCASLILK